MKGIFIHTVKINSLLAKRVKKNSWFYYVYTTGIFIFCLFLALISTNIVIIIDKPLEKNSMLLFDRAIFVVFLIFVNLTFWYRVHVKTIVKLENLSLFPLSPLQKYQILINLFFRDYRMSLYAGISLASCLFTLIISGLFGILTLPVFLVFFISTEIWLLDVLILMNRKFSKKLEQVAYTLGFLPLIISYPLILIKKSQWIEWIPFTSWYGNALFFARSMDLAMYLTYMGILTIVLFIGVGIGYILIFFQFTDNLYDKI